MEVKRRKERRSREEVSKERITRRRHAFLSPLIAEATPSLLRFQRWARRRCLLQPPQVKHFDKDKAPQQKG